MLLQTVSELFVNLGAGWYATILIAPKFILSYTLIQIFTLFLNGIFGTLCMIFAYKLRG